MAALLYPQARREGFVAAPRGGELILHNGEVTHLLNATAASVWQKCDGQRSIADIARELALEVAIVEYALQQLERIQLLQNNNASATLYRPMTRREFLKKGAWVAAAIPVVKTIRLPTPQQVPTF